MQKAFLQKQQETAMKELRCLHKKWRQKQLNKLVEHIQHNETLFQKTSYQLNHPMISKLLDVLLPHIIQICESYLLFDWCLVCNKSYPKPMGHCSCRGSHADIDTELFGSVSVLVDGVICFHDPRDYEIWTYLSGSDSSVLCQWQSVFDGEKRAQWEFSNKSFAIWSEFWMHAATCLQNCALDQRCEGHSYRLCRISHNLYDLQYIKKNFI